MTPLRLVAALAALFCIAAGFWQLSRATHGLSITSGYAGTTPVTIIRKKGADPAPVVIAHGFAGSSN